MADYSVRARLSADDNGFTSTLKKAMGAVGDLGSSIKSGLSFGFLSGAGQAAFNAISNGARDLIGEIDAANASWKTFNSNLAMLGWDEAAISSAQSTLQEFAQQTVYSSSDMATTFAQLAAVGVDDTAELVTAFGGLAAAAENPQQAMKTLSQQATQMAAKPTVAWADFKLMLEQTPAGIAAVAREMGMTTSELVTAVQDGEIATEDFFNAIKAAGGAGTELAALATEAKTVGQAMDGLKETAANKLMPAFDVLSQAGIKAVDGIAGALAGIDAQALADKVGAAVATVQQYWDAFKGSFEGVGAALSEAFSALSGAIQEVFGVAEGATALDTFTTICQNVANGIKTVAGFISEHADTIAAALPYVLGIAGAFKAMSIVNTLAPGLTSFATSLAQMAGKGIAGLAAKLFGVAGGQTAVGTASATSAPSILQSAVAVLALGGAVLLASAGLALLVQSAIALASAGWPAVAALVGLVGVIALLAVGAAALGPALVVAAPGLLAFGAAIALVGVGAVLAGAGLALVASVLPVLVANGTLGAVAIMQLGMAMSVFAVGAALAGAACVVLGAGLLVVGAALLVAGAAMILFGVGALLAAASLAILSAIMPTLATYGTASAVAILALGAALLVFGAGALVAGTGAIVLGAGLAVAAVGVAAFGVAIAAAALGAAAMGVALLAVATEMKSIAKNAKTAEKSLSNMMDAVSVIEAGLNALGEMAETAMNWLCDAFDGAEADAKASATSLITGVVAAFKAGYVSIFAAGAYISTGFANGMRSQLATVRSVASQLAAEADKAVRAKAQIASPSKVATTLGAYWGEGFANGIANMAGDVRTAANNLVHVPNVATPDLAMAYGGEMSGEYSYYRNSDYTIEVPLAVDGRILARATATYTQDELNRQQTRESRKHGRV